MLWESTCTSASFATKELFAILPSAVSLSKSSFEDIIVHSFGENKSVSHTKALVQIHITVQREVQIAVKANARAVGRAFAVLPERPAAVTQRRRCALEHRPYCKALTKPNLPATGQLLFAPLLTAVWLSLHDKEMPTGRGTLETSLLFTGSNKAPYVL